MLRADPSERLVKKRDFATKAKLAFAGWSVAGLLSLPEKQHQPPIGVFQQTHLSV
jgi:hypothetical protein